MGDNSFGHGNSNSISIGQTYWQAEWCATAVPSVYTLLKTIHDCVMQSIIYVPVTLELLPWGTMPSAMESASATSIGMLSGVPMLFHQPSHY